MRGDLLNKLLSCCCGIVALACGCGLPAGAQPAPGIYETPPPGVHSVKGACSGKLALTPRIPKAGDEGQPYPLVYDCTTRTFEVLKTQPNLVGLGDLTLTDEGYYLHLSKITDGRWHGGYYWYDHSGRQIGELTRPDDPKTHDLIVRNQERTYLNYVPDEDSPSCRRGAPLELEIITENLDGRVIWKWASKGRLDPGQIVGTDESMHVPPEGTARKWLKRIRNCYTAIARRAVKFETPKWTLWSDKFFALLRLELNDYIHVNSIQWVGPQDDLLISARHLDTIFLIDRNTGELKWSLGGKFAKATRNRPVDDPRGGFSHQQHAHIAGNTLWVFDNGNLFPDLPSRVVAYQLDSTPLPNRLIFEFLEPNAKQRYSLGIVQPLKNNELLIGWGAVNPADRRAPQRAVSIVRLDDGKEVFAMDLSPRWISYRAKAWQP